MLINKDTGKEMTLEEAMEKLKTMSADEKLKLLAEIYEQLYIEPLKNGIL